MKSEHRGAADGVGYVKKDGESVGQCKNGMENKDSNNDTAKDVNNVTEGFNSCKKNYVMSQITN